MELKNFGSILNFAAELEAGDAAFYSKAGANPAYRNHWETFAEMARDHQQNEQRILRARRENVTEMVLEPIKDFDGIHFVRDREAPAGRDLGAILQIMQDLEERAEIFYNEAAEKIKALPEVSQLFRRLAKIHSRQKEKLIG